ncbi:MAG: hypothetical protein JXA79_11240 [Deltaproteobacteria bacterium]|nr:hypothetical protein [Deltaproteobacteria bacterium]
MNNPYRLEVTLLVRAPLITSSGGNSIRGVDRMFNRNPKGDLILQGSHIKGKLREALEDLKTSKTGYGLQLVAWFGHRSDEGSYNPNRGSLLFDDFYLEQSGSSTPENSAVRISINPQTGTSREHKLFAIEKQFPSGSLTVWKGSIHFWAADHKAAARISDELSIGFKWMTSIGGIKGSGYGRLEKVSIKLESCTNLLTQSHSTSESRKFHLQIELDGELFIGGVVNSTNYLESRKVIPGAVLKGSFAKSLNEICGETFTCPIDADNEKVAAVFPKLVKNFWAIRFTHAFPAPPLAEKRPVTVPFSAVSASDNEYFDAAFYKSALLDHRKRSPEFAIDWKNPTGLNNQFGWADWQTINKTRTKIHKTTRTAEENMLYTFKSISPYIGNSDTELRSTLPKIRWIANITLPEDSRDLADEFCRAIHSGWDRLGKRSSRFRFELKEDHAEPALPQHQDGVLTDGRAIVTLQTETLMFDAYAQADLSDLHTLYAEYWSHATDGTCKMSHFFARQTFCGGYISNVYHLHANNSYFPYLLTAEGSVFVLEPGNGKENQAREVLQELQDLGLPLPKSIKEKIKDQNISEERAWTACPFVPENGFGEISINLEWHWKNRLPITDH